MSIYEDSNSWALLGDVPNVPLMREEPPFELTDEVRSEHVPWIDDYCLACGTDLRVPRKRVQFVTRREADRARLYEAAEYIATCQYTSAEQIRADREMRERGIADAGLRALSMAESERRVMVEYFVDGIDAEVTFSLCGLNGVELIGIGDDGTYLYGQPHELEIRRRTEWQRRKVRETLRAPKNRAKRRFRSNGLR